MPSPGGGNLGGSGKVAFSPAWANAGAEVRHSDTATNTEIQIRCLTVTFLRLVETTLILTAFGGAVIGRTGEDLLAVGQRNRPGVGGTRTVLSPKSLNGDLVACFE